MRMSSGSAKGTKILYSRAGDPSRSKQFWESRFSELSLRHYAIQMRASHHNMTEDTYSCSPGLKQVPVRPYR